MTRASPRRAKILPIHIEEAVALKRLFDERNKLSQATFAAESGIGSQGMLWQYLNAKSPLNAKAAERFAKALDVKVEDFSPRLAAEIAKLAESIDLEGQESEHVTVPMVDAKASAGKGTIIFSADVKKALMFRRDYLAKHGAPPEDTLAFQVDGDSMVDLHIPHGSIVLANRKKKEPVSRRVYVLWLNDELCVKQVVKLDGRWWARSHNAAKADDFKDRPIGNEDRIEGQAFWCGYDLR